MPVAATAKVVPHSHAMYYKILSNNQTKKEGIAIYFNKVVLFKRNKTIIPSWRKYWHLIFVFNPSQCHYHHKASFPSSSSSMLPAISFLFSCAKLPLFTLCIIVFLHKTSYYNRCSCSEVESFCKVRFISLTCLYIATLSQKSLCMPKIKLMMKLSFGTMQGCTGRGA